MSWKDELQVRDLDPDQILEFTCNSCGSVQHMEAKDLISVNRYYSKWLSEIENHTKCTSRGCNGSLKLSVYHDNSHSGFIGGMT